MAIAFRGGSTSLPSGTVTTYTITIPAAVQVSDLMLIAASNNGTAITTPTGWTLVRTDTDSTGVNSITAIYSRVATSGDTGGATTVTVVQGLARASAVLVAYFGVASTNPINISGGQGSTGTGTTLTAPSVTTTLPQCMIVEFFGSSLASISVNTITGPATSRESAANATTAVQSSDQPQSTAGATGTQTATTGAAGFWTGSTLALAPAVWPAFPSLRRPRFLPRTVRGRSFQAPPIQQNGQILVNTTDRNLAFVTMRVLPSGTRLAGVSDFYEMTEFIHPNLAGQWFTYVRPVTDFSDSTQFYLITEWYGDGRTKVYKVRIPAGSGSVISLKDVTI